MLWLNFVFLFLLSCASEPDNRRSDADLCSHVEILGSTLHKSINGIYQRTRRVYNDLPTFQREGKDGDKGKYLWWEDHSTHTRWYIGSVIGRQTVEAYRDGPVTYMDLISPPMGYYWQVVHDQEWKEDMSISAKCGEYSASEPEPQKQPEKEFANVVLVNTENVRIRQVYEHLLGVYNHGKPVFAAPTGVLLFYKQYSKYQRWYVGSELDNDHTVHCFVDVTVTSDPTPLSIPKDFPWSERVNNEWTLNKNMMVVPETDPVAQAALKLNKAKEPALCSVVGMGAADDDMNQRFQIMAEKIEGRPVYIAPQGEYIWWQKYAEESDGSWVLGFSGQRPGEGEIQAKVQSDAKSLDTIETTMGWSAWDEQRGIWVQEVDYMQICTNCVLTVSGGITVTINGKWELDEKKVEHGRPVFRKGKQLVYYMEHREFGRWYITNEEGRVGSASNVIAFVNADARSPNLLDRSSIWSERSSPRKGKFNPNNKIVFAGDCVKARKRPLWQENRSMSGDGCPSDQTYRTLKDEDYAVVYWTDPMQDMAGSEIMYHSGDNTPGSRFYMGRTGVVYSVRHEGRIVRTCEFVITVEDKDPPLFECPNDIFVDINNDEKDVLVQWGDPIAIDGVDAEVKVKQVRGPPSGSRLAKGVHRIIYEAFDSKDNQARCIFRVRVQDTMPPVVTGCPKDITLEVFKDNNWSAHPKWNEPKGHDNVDGEKVIVTQVAGLHPGEAFTVGPSDEENTITQIYHISDKSGNVATCQFNIMLRKSHGSDKGVDFQGELETEAPEEPDYSSNDIDEQRAHHFNELRDLESSKLEKIMKEAQKRIKTIQDITSGGHISKLHAERLARMKDEGNLSPRLSTLAEESSSSWRWTLFKAVMIALPLAGLGGGIILYFSGYLFAPKGKRVPSQSHLSVSSPRWMKNKSQEKIRRRRV